MDFKKSIAGTINNNFTIGIGAGAARLESANGRLEIDRDVNLASGKSFMINGTAIGSDTNLDGGNASTSFGGAMQFDCGGA